MRVIGVAWHTTRCPPIDLTPFGFTPTEGVVYKVLLRDGPGTGYCYRSCRRSCPSQRLQCPRGPRRKRRRPGRSGPTKAYRPEPPAALLARIASDHGQALSRLTTELEALAAPPTPTLVEITSSRGALQLIQHDVARAAASVDLLAPAEAFPLLGPALRRPVLAGLDVRLHWVGPVELGFAPVAGVAGSRGMARCADHLCGRRRAALLATRQGADVTGHWGTAPAFVAAARFTIDVLGRSA